MSLITSRLPSLFADLILNPTFDVLAGILTPFGPHGNRTERSNATSSISGIELTADDIQFYYTMRFVWSLTTTVLLASVFCTAAYFCYIFIFVPCDRIRRLGSIGYLNHEVGEVSKREIANLIRRRRKIGEDLPPVYPNGWFRLLDSLQLKRGQVKEVSAIGQHFAVFRSKSGKASILDAYCPHMGGNLAIGGMVKGECLECPFHGWVFKGDGECVSIPYSDKIPSFAKTKSWPCREVNGAIFVWYHCDDVEPQWEIPEVEEITRNKYSYKGRVEHHVNTHIQDLPENGSDQAHLSHLHVPSVMAGSDLSQQFKSWWNFADHIFTAEALGPKEGEPHISIFNLLHYLLIFSRWRLLQFDFKVYQIGPGMVHLYFTSNLWKGVFVQTLTPIEPLHQVLTHNLYSTWTLPMWLGRIFLYVEAIQVDRDVMIWNNKTFKPRPKLVKEDKQITKYRRWFSQFYTENSPRLQMKTNDDCQW